MLGKDGKVTGNFASGNINQGRISVTWL